MKDPKEMCVTAADFYEDFFKKSNIVKPHPYTDSPPVDYENIEEPVPEVTFDELIYTVQTKRKKKSLGAHVGYLGAGFDYFSKGFVHTPDQKEIEASQDRTRRALSNALFTFSLAPFQTGEKPQMLQKYYEKIIYFLKCRARFAHKSDQNL